MLLSSPGGGIQVGLSREEKMMLNPIGGTFQLQLREPQSWDKVCNYYHFGAIGQSIEYVENPESKTMVVTREAVEPEERCDGAGDVEVAEGGENGGERDWAGLLPEALAEIFARLPFEDRLGGATRVCRSWNEAARDPASWTRVDMEPWIQRRTEEDYWWEFECEPKMDHLVKVVVDRSQGRLRELRTSHVSDSAVDHIAHRCPRLAVLSMPNSLLVTDRSAVKLASGCPRLEQLDVSDCYNISMAALAAFGRNCPSLARLGRNMLRRSSSGGIGAPAVGSPGGDEEAIVVARHMGRLTHLEMKRTSLSDLGLRHLASGCRRLENLNLACCTALSPTALDHVARLCHNLKTFTKPITPRMHVNPNCHIVLFE